MGGTPPQYPHTTMTIQLDKVINAASEMARSQAILPIMMLRKHTCGTKQQKHRPKKSKQPHPNSISLSNEIHEFILCVYMSTETWVNRCLVTSLWSKLASSGLEAKSPSKRASRGAGAARACRIELTLIHPAPSQHQRPGWRTHPHTDIRCSCSVSFKRCTFPKITFPGPSLFFLAQRYYLLVQKTKISLQAITHSSIIISFQQLHVKGKSLEKAEFHFI